MGDAVLADRNSQNEQRRTLCLPARRAPADGRRTPHQSTGRAVAVELATRRVCQDLRPRAKPGRLRSAVCRSPFLRGLSPNCDQTKTRFSILPAHSVQVRCSRYADSAGARTCVVCRPVDGSSDAGAAAAVPVVCRMGAGRRPPDRSQSDVVMSRVVDSGPSSGHGNIDANDPFLKSQPHKYDVTGILRLTQLTDAHFTAGSTRISIIWAIASAPMA
jgi:hypothetical protein